MKKILTTTVLCGVLAGTLIPYNAYALTQEETVYAKLTEGGALDYISVTGHLINDLRDPLIVMPAGLKEVENLNGFEEYNINDDKLVWQANGNDIYYSGKTDQNLPIEVEVTYSLNGEQKQLDEILGKSGKVEVKLRYRNLSKVDDLYTPFVVVMGTVLDETNVRNVEVTNGKVISNGQGMIVSAIAAPGLYESLRYEELQKMDEIVFTYETEKFELKDIYNFVTPKVLDDNDLKIFEQMDDLYGNMDQLSSSSKELAAGTGKLRSGLQQLRDAVLVAKDKLSGIGDYADEKMLNSIAETAAKTARQEVAKEQGKIRTEVQQQMSEILNSVNLDSIENTLTAGAKDLVTQQVTAMMNAYLEANPDKAVAAQEIAKLPATELQTFCATSAENAKKCQDAQIVNNKKSEYTAQATNTVMATMGNLKNNLPTVDTKKIEEKLFNSIYSNMQNVAGQTAAKTARTVAEKLLATLENNLMPKLNNLFSELESGIEKLLSGANELDDGMQKFDKEGIQTLNNFVNGEIKSTSDRLQKLTELADKYNNYGGVAENAKSSTKFILMIDGKKASED